MNVSPSAEFPESHFAMRGELIGEEGQTLSTSQLGMACRVSLQQVEVWVVEGVLQPSNGSSPGEWRFGSEALRRMRVAERLRRDLDLTPTAVAVALDLLDRVAALEARLHRAGLGEG